MRILYIMDPLDRMTHDKDTTFAFMRAGRERGHRNLHCLPHQISVTPSGVIAHTHEAIIFADPPYFSYGEAKTYALKDIDAVMIRKDPPFDQAYLYTTQCLEHAREDCLIVNDPRGLRDANEKLFALQFRRWMPDTIVSSDRSEIRAFINEVGGKAVIKPLDGAGGAGVMLARTGDKNLPAILDMLTAEGGQLAMVQAFLPDVTVGDKRVILLDGKPLGGILRVPKDDDLRSNIHVGGSVVPTELTPRELELIEDISPTLRKAGLYFVGLDLIGEHLTEVNVTSPTGIQELSRFSGESKESEVIRWLEEKVGS